LICVLAIMRANHNAI